MPSLEPDRPTYRSFLDKFRPNPLLQDPSSLNRLPESPSPVYCHGPLCKTFICSIDTLPIGHSVLIQLKAYFRYNRFQSVEREKRTNE